jgi:pimeloyl-ACP methyl ester carboxylesterase
MIHSNAAASVDGNPEVRVSMKLPAGAAGDWSSFQREVVVRGRRIVYLDVGAHERTCVLIHGLAASFDYWLENIPALSATHRVIALDLPGFGRSEDPAKHGFDHQLPVFDEFLAELGLGNVDVIGHSMGTLVGCEFAARYPERVRRLILAGGPITSVVDLFNAPLRTLLKKPRVAAFLVEAFTAWIPLPAFVRRWIVKNRWARKLAFGVYVPRPESLSEEIMRGVLTGVGAPAVLPTLREGFGYDYRPALTSLSCPTMIVAGELDNISPPSDAFEFAASNRAVKHVEVLSGTGHCPMFERPDAFNRLMSDFLAA